MSSLLGLLSCLSPNSVKDKQKTVEVMATQISAKFKAVEHISIEEFKKLQRDSTVILVDVRPENERKVSVLPNSISKEEFLDKKEQFRNKKIVSYCTIGYRSAEFTKVLKEKNFQAFNLKGGLLSWAHQGGLFEINGSPTKRAHVYEEAWNFLPKGYQGVWHE